MNSKRIEAEDYDDENFMEYLKEFTESDEVKDLENLTLGYWGDPYEGSVFSHMIRDYLIENKDKFPELKSIFFGDMDSEMCEISWIELDDMAELIMAFPKLESFRIKGGIGLRFENLKHNNLKELEVICGGLPKNSLEDLSKACLPKLETLNLYLGCEYYGFDGKIEDILPFMNKNLFPNLKNLGLKNSEIQNEIAEKIVVSEIIDQIETLDLSMGTMTDKGADFLLNSEKIKNLKLLNIKDNYISLKTLAKFKKLEIEVIRGKQDDDDGSYYTSISE